MGNAASRAFRKSFISFLTDPVAVIPSNYNHIRVARVLKPSSP
jgi:hypothetical protein